MSLPYNSLHCQMQHISSTSQKNHHTTKTSSQSIREMSLREFLQFEMIIQNFTLSYFF